MPVGWAELQGARPHAPAAYEYALRGFEQVRVGVRVGVRVRVRVRVRVTVTVTIRVKVRPLG